MGVMQIAASITPNRTKFGPLLFPGELGLALATLSELGYQGVELSLRTKDDLDRRAFVKSLQANKLRLFSIATGQSYVEDGLSLFASEDRARAGAVERIKDHVDFASEFEAQVIIGGIRGKLERAGDADARERGEGAIEACISYAEKKKVTLLLEPVNRYETNVFNTVGEIAEFMLQHPSRYLQILPDTFHMNIEESDMVASLVANKDSIGALHCADSNRLAPGMGHVDFGNILEAVKSFRNIRYLGVEVLPLPDSRRCAETAIGTIKACL
jgi:sugar phosphate isomerase/epimerase